MFNFQDFEFGDDGSIWYYGKKELYQIFSKDEFKKYSPELDKFSYSVKIDSTKINQVNLSNITKSEDGTIFLATQGSGILYLGKDPVSVEDTEERDNVFALMKLYPNPTKNKVNAELHCNATFNPELTDVAIYSYSGQLISNIDRFTISHNKSNGTANIEFNANGIPSGYYFLCISVGGEKKMQSIVIE